MYTVPENLEPLEPLDGDSEFLEQFKQEVDTDESIHACNAVTDGI